MAIQSHKDLDVWKKAVAFVIDLYELTKQFPKEELYGLTSQMRRAAVSIPSNIAEGRSKRSTREYMRFINIACGSAAELETHLVISQGLKYISSVQLEKYNAELSTIARMLNGIYSALEKKLDAIS
jgi:four helix bundle protein